MRRPQRPHPPRPLQPQTQRLPPMVELAQQLKEMVNNSGKVLLFHYHHSVEKRKFYSHPK